MQTYVHHRSTSVLFLALWLQQFRLFAAEVYRAPEESRTDHTAQVAGHGIMNAWNVTRTDCMFLLRTNPRYRLYYFRGRSWDRRLLLEKVKGVTALMEGNMARQLPRVARKWTPTFVALGIIPLIVTPIDEAVTSAMDDTVRIWLHTGKPKEE